jgi:hypothetical protein
MMVLFIVALRDGWWLARDLRAHPANFREAAASHGQRIAREHD